MAKPRQSTKLATIRQTATSRFQIAGIANRPEKTVRQSFSHADHSNYRTVVIDAVLLHQAERMQLPAVKTLMDYVWEHGGHQLTITRDDSDPDRESWASMAFHFMVPNALWRLWDEVSVRCCSATGTWTSWEVSECLLNQLANDLASIEVGNGAQVTVTVPLLQLALMDTASFELEPGVTLQAWNQEDRAWYLHRNKNIYPFDDAFGPYKSDCYLTIVVNSKKLFKGGERQDEADEFISSIVARVKWAVMQATDPAQIVTELPATVEIQQSMTGVFPIRRQSIQRRRSGGIRLGVDGCKAAATLLTLLKGAMVKFPDISDVIWMFDRATLATLPRDILFESAVGLERLLVANAGENSRRFRDYGTALISNGDDEKTLQNLKEIYTLRSSAAHGTSTKTKNYEIFGVIARKYLSGAIERVVRLVEALKLEPAKGVTVNRAVEKYLLSLLFAASRKDFPRDLVAASASGSQDV